MQMSYSLKTANSDLLDLQVNRVVPNQISQKELTNIAFSKSRGHAFSILYDMMQ